MIEGSSMDGTEESARSSEPRSSRSQPRGVLEIRHAVNGSVRYELLQTARLVIGSDRAADIVLADASVSASHAELVCGPSGQWWIHDLGSRDGTLVRGVRTDEQMLAAGEEIAVGVFRLRLRRRTSVELHLGLSPEVTGPATSRMGSPPAPGPGGEVDAVSLEVPGPAPETHPGQIGAAHLWKVMSLGRELMQVEDIAARRSLLCRFAAGDGLPGEASAVLRVMGPRTVRAVEGPMRREGPNLPLFLADRITRQLWETQQPVFLSASASNKPAAGWKQAIAVCPLHVDHDFLEALYVELPPEYGGPEWCSLIALAAEAFQQAELVWDMRSHVRESSSVERELDMARQIQQGLVPRPVRFDSVLQELDVVVGFEPCRWVGGDYVDAVPMPDGRILLAIGDVCGKGMQAALVASSLHTLVRATVDMEQSVSDLVRRINRHMCCYLPDHVFVTMLCMAVNLRTGELEVVSAGHPAAMIADPYGRVWSVDVGHNVALGVMDTEIVSGNYLLGPDQTLLLYTDGLTEAVDEHRMPLGSDKLAEYFSRIATTHSGRGTHAVRDALFTALRAYRGSRLTNDDTTFLVARRSVSMRPPPMVPNR